VDRAVGFEATRRGSSARDSLLRYRASSVKTPGSARGQCCAVATDIHHRVGPVGPPSGTASVPAFFPSTVPWQVGAHSRFSVGFRSEAVNIFLLPYTWMRHLSMAFWCGSAGLLAWWGVLTLLVVANVNWPPTWDGPILMTSISVAVCVASVFGEANLRRLPIWRRGVMAAIAAGVSGGITLVYYFLWHAIVGVVLSGDMLLDAGDPSLVSLTFRVGAFAMGGLGCGTGAMLVRKFKEPVSHLAGGLAAGLSAGSAWFVTGLPTVEAVLGFSPQRDLFLAGATMGVTWGFVFGLLAWSIPDELYAGWLRILTPRRFGRRIPVDAPDRSAKERFVGHFPRGLDLFLPVEDGVQELHFSVTVDARQRYTARGLSQHHTMVKRLLQSVDLRYDPRRPTPVETSLASGDRIILGEGDNRSELEFILLPREEV